MLSVKLVSYKDEEMDLQQNDDNGNTALSDVEKTSDTYLNELQGKLFELRQKLDEEKIVSGELEEIACGQQGRISVHYQRSDELDAENFNEMMNQAEDELANAKDESFNLSTDIIGVYRNMLQDVENEAGRLEAFRIQFKSVNSIEECAKSEAAHHDEKQSEIVNAENEILSMDKENDDILQSMQAFTECDGLMEFYLCEMEEAENEIANLSLKLHAIQGQGKDSF